MHSLDPLALNLDGLRLIEASAGTGKTYTLTTLYLRLLLERGLEPSKILVVTFTEAATESLREKVRERIVHALAQLEMVISAKTQQAADQTSNDPVLTKLLARLPSLAAAQSILANALARLDEAAIYTIHGFCSRMLQDYAFESGTSSAAELLTNESALRQAAVSDVWRHRLDDVSLEEAAWIRASDWWPNPDKLLATLASTLPQDDLQLLPPLDATKLAKTKSNTAAKLAQLRTDWPQERDAIATVLEKSKALNRKSYTKNVIIKAMAAMDALAATDSIPQALSEYCRRLSADMLATKCKPNTTPPTNPLFDLCAELDQELPKLEKLRQAMWFQEAWTQTREALRQAKATKELLAFDDLLRHLDQALAGTQGLDADSVALAEAIRNRFPIALIDEFQDTDAKQYRIFQRIYGDHQECGLFLIGDPKQAIYSFRGADVFTYMGAKNDAIQAGSSHTLEVNWRSSGHLITAINALFNNTPNPFLYAEHIPFQAVKSAPTADKNPFIIDGIEPNPLLFWNIPLTPSNANQKQKGVVRATAATAEAACACAEHIAKLLQAADAGRAMLGNDRLHARDIAVLVRTHREGEQIQQALRACNISSVSLSQDRVFATEQALELTVLLEAVVNSNDEGRVRTALASVLLGWNATELDVLSHNEAEWEQVLARFQTYRQQWLERGFMVAFQRLLHQERIPQRLLQRPDGQRWLTNLLQLAELLQTNAHNHSGPRELLRWLITQQTADAGPNETEQLRLESDESLVKVVTMHKSKGLEYPVVFIPFPWSHRKPSPKQPPVFHDPDTLNPCLDLGTDDQELHHDLQRIETLAEQMRLFYVAVTRAARLCVICWGKITGAEDSALALLLHPDPSQSVPSSRLKQLDTAGIRTDLEALAAQAAGCIAVQDLPEPTGVRWAGAPVDVTRLQATTFRGCIDANWSIASYSGLVRKEESWQPDHDKPAAIPDADASSTTSDPILNFPAGAEVGQYLHTLLERLDFPKAHGETLHTAVQELLLRYGGLGKKPPPDGASNWGDVTELLLTNCLNTPLESATEQDAEELRLRDISWSNRISELEFHYPLANLTPKALQATLAPFPLYQASAADLEFKPCQGLMHGFIDLVFRHQGRYYIADYKSNRLGLHLQDYGQAGMLQAIREHRYDLQYLVYSVALHRFLQQRLTGYDYDQHFGGAYYLFLRGMRPEFGPQYGVYFDRPSRQVTEALSTLFG